MNKGKTKLRLDKLLSNMGYGSRKDLKKVLKEGHVLVNGETIKDGGFQVNVEQDNVSIYGEEVQYKPYIYLMLNKPAGYISATEDVRERTVLELVPERYAHYELFPVGRLDKDTEGLLILTNDGQFAHDVLSPKKHVSKTYYARVRGCIGNEEIEAFQKGIVLDDGYQSMPATLKLLKQGVEESEIHVTLFEGKFHQVKRMFEACGSKVLYLMRISMGELGLDPLLEKGEIKELTPEEKAQIR